MRIFATFLCLGLVFLLFQTALISFILPKGLHPDTALLIVFFLGINYVTWSGVITAFSLGYLTDLFSGSILGTSSFSLVIVFFVAYVMAKKIDFQSYYMVILGSMVLEGLYLLSVFFLNNIFQEGLSVLSFGTTLIEKVVVTGFFSPLFLYLFYKIEGYIVREPESGKAF